MVKPVVVVKEETTLEEIARIMSESRIGGLPVLSLPWDFVLRKHIRAGTE